MFFRHPDKNYSTHRLLIGTHTSNEADNFVIIRSLNLPNPVSEADPRHYDEERAEIGGYGAGGDETKFNDIKIPHEGEVNKARYMPQNPDLIATMSPSGNVFIFDRTKQGSITSGAQCRPDMTLEGHKKEGSVLVSLYQ